jgi:hypothetical protein
MKVNINPAAVLRARVNGRHEYCTLSQLAATLYNECNSYRPEIGTSYSMDV